MARYFVFVCKLRSIYIYLSIYFYLALRKNARKICITSLSKSGTPFAYREGRQNAQENSPSTGGNVNQLKRSLDRSYYKSHENHMHLMNIEHFYSSAAGKLKIISSWCVIRCHKYPIISSTWLFL